MATAISGRNEKFCVTLYLVPEIRAGKDGTINDGIKTSIWHQLTGNQH